MTLAPAREDIETDGALNEKLASSTMDPARAVSLPPEMYRSQAIFEWERSEIFMKEWLCVGRSTDFTGVGDYKSLELVGEPIIVVRGEDGLHAFSAVCRHRGMIITVDVDAGKDAWMKPQPESKGNCPRAFRCPYHFWQYDLKGQLISAPEMERSEGFNPANVKLPALAIEEWQGFVFVNFNPQAKPLSPRLAPVMGLIKNWGIDEMVG
ncbi:MAG: Rieske (2Fe-2S) protein, partial [Acidimicrobiia bacterium]|nr:Rieske (2Fe-2S) protein [Acidimicrobiia bacterium]